MAITKIATVEVGSGGAATIDFTSIPSTYTDLMVVYSLRSAGSAHSISTYVRFNGDTSSTNYFYRRLYGSGGGAYSETGTSLSYSLAGGHNAATSTTNTFANSSIYLPNYAASTNKSFSVDSVQEDNQTEAYQQLVAGLWQNTTAINRVTLGDFGGNTIVQYSSATLYGITKGSSGGVVVS